MTARRRIRRVVLAVLAVLGLTLALVALGLFPQEWLRRSVEQRLQSTFGRQATLGRIHVVPILMRVEIEELRIDTPDFRLEVPRARARLAFETLTGRAYALRSLDVENPRLDVLPAPPPPVAKPERAAATLDRPLRLDDLQVTGAVVVYHDPALGGDLRLEGIGLHGAVGGELTLEASGGAWRGRRPLVFGKTEARLHLTPWLDVTIGTLKVGTLASRFTVHGSLGRLTDLRPDLTVDGHLNLDDLATLGGPPSTGVLSASGHVRGVGDADVRLEGRDLRVAGGSVPRLTVNANHSLGVTDVKATAAVFGGRVEGEARLVGSRATGQVRLAGLDIAAVRKAAVPTAPAVRGTLGADLTWEGDLRTGLETRGSVVLDAHGADGGTLRARADASGRVRPLDGRLDLAWNAIIETPAFGDAQAVGLGPGRVEAAGSLRGGVRMEVDGRFEARAGLRTTDRVEEITASGSLRAIGSRAVLSLEGRGFGGRATVEADISGDAVRSLELRGQAFDLTALGGLAPGLAGTASFTLDATGRLDRLDGTGRASLDGLTARGFATGPVGIGIELHRGAAAFTVEARELNATGKGRIDPRTRQVEATLRLEKTPVARLASVIAPERRVTGDVSGQVEFRASLDRLGEPDLTLSNLRLDGEGMALDGSGRLRLGREPTVEAEGRLVADLGRLPVPETFRLTGRLEADVRLQGPLRRPRATGQATAQAMAVEGPRLPALSVESARLRFADDVVVLDETAFDLAGGSVTLSGRAPIAAFLSAARARPDVVAPAEQADLRVAWRGLEAARLLRAFLPARDLPVTATLAGEVQVTGGLTRLGEVRAQAVLAETNAAVGETSLRLAPAAVHLEQGRVRLEPLSITTGDSTVRLAGAADLAGGPLAATVTGRLDARALSPLLGEASLTGVADLDVSITGTLRRPDLAGRLALRDATLRLRTIPQSITALGAELRFDRSRVSVENGAAVLGGGDVRFSGRAALTGLRLEDVRLELTGRDVALRYPEGLRSRVDADLALTGGWASLKLAGTVRAKRGLYDRDIVLEESLFAATVEPTRSPLLRAIALEIRVETENPVKVKNNIADLTATGGLMIRGDLETPVPFGRLDVVTPSAKVLIYGQDFQIQQGEFVYEGSWVPRVTLEANRRIQDDADGAFVKYLVTVGVTGFLDRLQPWYRAESISTGRTEPLSTSQIIGLITTGNSGNEVSARSGAATAGGQVALLMAGRVARGVSQRLRGLGLGEVRIQPDLVARETDPSARFTFGIPVAPKLDLIYSLGLRGPEDRFVKVEGRPGPLLLFAQRAEDDVFSVGVGQRFEWGGRPQTAPPADEKVVLRDVRFEGADPALLSRMRKAARARVGKRVDFWELQEEADRLRARLRRDGYIEAEVGALLTEGAAVYLVRSGHRYTWRVSGLTAPPDLTGVIREALHEEEALDKGQARLLRELHGRGHLRAAVEAQALRDGDTRVLTFNVDAGPSLEVERLAFPGARALSQGRLGQEAGGAAAILTDPDAALARIRDAYRRIHHLAADAGPPRVVVSEDGRRIRIDVPVREGRRARVAAIVFEGASQPQAELAAVAALETGEPFDETRLQAAVDQLREHHFGLGYPAVRVTPRVVPDGSDLDVVFEITEGERVAVGAVEVTGAIRTPQSLVVPRLGLKPGDPLDPRKLALAERRVMQLGLFSRVTLTAKPGTPATIRVAVTERPSASATYNARYSDIDGVTVVAEGELRHLLGAGLAIGARHQGGANLQETRTSLQLPLWFVPATLTTTAFRIAEKLPTDPADPDGPRNRQTTVGVQIQNSLQLPNRWQLQYGYRFKRATTESPLPQFHLDIAEDVAALHASLTRDSRDDVLDPRRGRLLSVNVELSPAALGGSFTFIKGFAQAFVTRPVTPSLTWAQAYRLGIAHAFGGQILRREERFRAGGANSVRGFATDTLGPRGSSGTPTLGDAVLILNQELRYRHSSGFGAAVFYDAGNVFAASRDVSLRLRHSVGIGLRWHSPLGPFRVDLGIPLRQRGNERGYQYFLTLGHSF